MSRKKEDYIVYVHLPDSKDKLIELRKCIGSAYIKFAEDYIKTLSIADDLKNEIYFHLIQKLNKKSSA